MIYLIGGAYRIGKTTLSRRILREKGIPYISTDLLRNSLYTFLGRPFPEKWDDRPEEFFPYLKDFIRRCENKYPEGVVIEGDIFLPQQISQIKNNNIKCCFLGASNITVDQIKDSDPTNWVNYKSPEEQEYLPQGIMRISNIYKEESEKYGFIYFDIYPDREGALKAAYDYLFE